MNRGSVILKRLNYAIVEKAPLTASGYDEAVAWFVFKYQALAYLREQVPNRKERQRFEVVRLRPFIYTGRARDY